MRFVALLVLAVALGACAKDSAMAPPATRLAFGEWGADRAQVVASDSLTEVMYDCTAGEFAGSIPLDASGRFAVNGSFFLFGPISVNGPMPAQLSGLVEGNTLTFAIAVNDTAGKRVISLGPQVVVLGQPANIVVCPAL